MQYTNYKDLIIEKLVDLSEYNNKRLSIKPNFLKDFDRSMHKRQVIDELNSYIQDIQYSELFINQLIDLHGYQYVKIDNKYFPYSLSDIYRVLEKIVQKKVEHKPFTRCQSKFYNKNVFHVHHSKSYYDIENLIRYFTIKYKDESSLINRINEINKLFPDKNPLNQIAQETLIESFDWNKKTGEWIVFQFKNDAYYFVGLSLHSPKDDYTDKKLYDQIGKYLREDF